MSAPPSCPRCGARLGMSRWCGTCGLDLRPDLPPSQAPEAQQARELEQRWLAGRPPGAPGYLPPAHATAPVVAPGITADTSPTGKYRDMRASSMVAGRWLWFCFGLALVALVLDVLWLKKEAGGPWAWEDLANLGKLMDTLAVVQLLVTIIGAVIFIIWFQRGYSNLTVLSPFKPRWSRGWAIAGWFVPLVSLVIPKQIANDLWRAGEGDARVPAVVHWWWALFLLSSVLGGFAGSAMGDAYSLEEFRRAILIDAFAQVLTAISAVAAIAVVGGTSRRQRTRAQTLGLVAEGAR